MSHPPQDYLSLKQPISLFNPDSVVPLRWRALSFFLPSILLWWALVGLYLFTREQAVEQTLSEQAGERLAFVTGEINEELDGLLEDLKLIASHSDLLRFLRAGDDEVLRRLEASYSHFAASKRIYDQVRFIDTAGLERIRVNFAGGMTQIVSTAQLQNKAGRYYFKESIRLQPGQLFISPLDLNIEQGRIERPLKPMIRLAAPVFVEHELRGIVVLNYLAERLLRHLRETPRAAGLRMLMLNSDGYYIKGPSAELEWGFMYPKRAEAGLFQEDFPDVWETMMQSRKGRYTNDQGMFAFTEVQFPPAAADWNGSRPVKWKLIRHLSSTALWQASQQVRGTGLATGFAGTLVIAVLSLYLAYLVGTNRIHRQTGVVLGTQLNAIMSTAPDAILCINVKGRLELFNPAAERMFECPFGDLRARPLEKLLPGLQETLGTVATARKVHGEGSYLGVLRREMELKTCEGNNLPVELALSATRIDGENLYIGILRDISERHEAAERIRLRSYVDELTDLPNRAMLQVELENALDSVRRRGMFGALLFMDLDYFKNINDSLGHQAGDLLLKQVARRIQDCLRGDDLVARLGGDEFVILLPILNAERRQASLLARDLAEKVRSALNRPMSLDGHDYVVTPSVGVVLFPDTADDADGLLKQADTAMYRAKAAGRNTIRLFQPRMQAEVDERLTLSKELHKAIRQNELMLYLQPQINAGTGRVVGAETLVRWRHEERGVLTPAAFLPQAEELGLGALIGDWVLRRALDDLATLIAHPVCGQLDFLAVNISPLHFRRPDFLTKLKALLEERNVPPQRLELEITENLLLHDIEEAVAKMKTLKDLGIRFAIDDFGTGFSSLAYLRQLPLTRLKIDRSFVTGVHEDPHNASIVDTIIAMARIQHLELTAEGVETDEEKDWLLQRGCEQVQGYLYSRPIPLVEFIDFCESSTVDGQGSRQAV